MPNEYWDGPNNRRWQLKTKNFVTNLLFCYFYESIAMNFTVEHFLHRLFLLSSCPSTQQCVLESCEMIVINWIIKWEKRIVWKQEVGQLAIEMKQLCEALGAPCTDVFDLHLGFPRKKRVDAWFLWHSPFNSSLNKTARPLAHENGESHI